MVSRFHCKVLSTGGGRKKKWKLLEIKHDMGLAVTEKSDGLAEKSFLFYVREERVSKRCVTNKIVLLKMSWVLKQQNHA